MTISLPCSIKGCTNFTAIDLAWKYESSSDFVLCEQCEQAVMIDNLVTLERLEFIPAGTAKHFATLWNAFKRRTKGSAVPHRPINIGMARPLVRPLGDEEL